MAGEIASATPFPGQGLEGKNQKGAREQRHRATAEEAAVYRLALTDLVLLRASDLFAENSRLHAENFLREGDVAFYAGELQVEGGSSPGLDTWR